MNVHRTIVLVAAMALSSWDTAVGATPPASVGAAPEPCATVPSLANDLPTAFAYDLQNSPAILKWLTALGSVPARSQKRVLESVVAAASTSTEAEVERFVAAACPNLDGIYGSSRALFSSRIFGNCAN